MNKTSLIFVVALVAITGLSYSIVQTIDNRYTPLPVYGGADHSIESFKLTNQLDETFDSEEHLGKIWVVNYFFTSCPSICPKMMKNMQEVHSVILNDEEVLLLSLTVDPVRDQPTRLMNFLENYNVNHENWQLLTGEKKDLYRLARKSFLVSATDGGGDQYDFIHSENIVVIDKEQKVRTIINGLAEDAEGQILSAISKLRT